MLVWCKMVTPLVGLVVAREMKGGNSIGRPRSSNTLSLTMMSLTLTLGAEGVLLSGLTSVAGPGLNVGTVGPPVIVSRVWNDGLTPTTYRGDSVSSRILKPGRVERRRRTLEGIEWRSQGLKESKYQRLD